LAFRTFQGRTQLYHYAVQVSQIDERVPTVMNDERAEASEAQDLTSRERLPASRSRANTAKSGARDTAKTRAFSYPATRRDYGARGAKGVDRRARCSQVPQSEKKPRATEVVSTPSEVMAESRVQRPNMPPRACAIPRAMPYEFARRRHLRSTIDPMGSQSNERTSILPVRHPHPSVN
jgi:hypothetical protein